MRRDGVRKWTERGGKGDGVGKVGYEEQKLE
jgi:hypothetical protein